jgi:hypothetical protein
MNEECIKYCTVLYVYTYMWKLLDRLGVHLCSCRTSVFNTPSSSNNSFHGTITHVSPITASSGTCNTKEEVFHGQCLFVSHASEEAHNECNIACLLYQHTYIRTVHVYTVKQGWIPVMRLLKTSPVVWEQLGNTHTTVRNKYQLYVLQKTYRSSLTPTRFPTGYRKICKHAEPEFSINYLQTTRSIPVHENTSANMYTSIGT